MIPHRVDPIADPRWSQLVRLDARSTIFHSPGWLLALRETYGYEPVVVTTSTPSQPLVNGVVFCRIKSWFTGSRLVSLPFSDHCDPLIGAGDDAGEFANAISSDKGAAAKWNYVEMRPLEEAPRSGYDGFKEAEKFWLHRLDLSPSAEKIFRHFHADCVRRKIRRAERERLVYEEGNNPTLLDSFYQLLLRTRRRHRLPPQPKTWFRNLAKFLRESLKIRVASKDGQPIASIITLGHKNKLVYKYGCSDERYHRFGGIQLLLWRTIQEAKEKNYSEFDMGRCELENHGLRVFKDRWGTSRSNLTYWRSQPVKCSVGRGYETTRRLFRLCPPSLLQVAGRSFYRHIG